MGTLFNVRAWFEANRQKIGGVAKPHIVLRTLCNDYYILNSHDEIE